MLLLVFAQSSSANPCVVKHLEQSLERGVEQRGEVASMPVTSGSLRSPSDINGDARTPVGRRGGWSDGSIYPGRVVTDSNELQIAGMVERGPPVNAPTTIGNRDYSGHAIDRMQQRGYGPLVVEDAIKAKNRYPSYSKDGKVVESVGQYYSEANNFTVVVDDISGRVITVRGGPPRGAHAN